VLPIYTCVLPIYTLGHCLNFEIHRIIMFSFMCVCGRNHVARGGVGTEDYIYI